jgi:hypothetical protein
MTRSPSLHRPGRALALAIVLAPAPLLAQAPGAAAPDAKAAAVADQCLEALGGQKAWDALRFLRFDFSVEREGKVLMNRSHWWDKHTGRYRVEGKTQEGESYVVLMNLNTQQGTVYLKGAKLDGDQEKEHLKRGFGAWVNDTYWLLMPYKMKDPGVILAYEGEDKREGGAWDKVVLTFDDVGLTPKDKYWAFVNKKTGMVDRWEYILKGGPGPATAWQWKGWQKHGGVMLATERVNPKDGSRIFFPVLETPESIPDAAFTSPAAVAAK